MGKHNFVFGYIRLKYETVPKTSDGLIHVAPGNLQLMAYDDLSGINNIRYSKNNGQEIQTPVPAVTVTLQNKETIKFYSVDNVGNTGETKTAVADVDFTPPVTTLIKGFGKEISLDFLSKGEFLGNTTFERTEIKDGSVRLRKGNFYDDFDYNPFYYYPNYYLYYDTYRWEAYSKIDFVKGVFLDRWGILRTDSVNGYYEFDPLDIFSETYPATPWGKMSYLRSKYKLKRELEIGFKVWLSPFFGTVPSNSEMIFFTICKDTGAGMNPIAHLTYKNGGIGIAIDDNSVTWNVPGSILSSADNGLVSITRDSNNKIKIIVKDANTGSVILEAHSNEGIAG